MSKVTVLVDNQAREGFDSEHGLSLLIEAFGKKILFDTGETDIFLNNAKKLDISLDDLSFIFLSHKHNDHTGGLAHLDFTAPIYVGNGILEKCYSRHDDGIYYDISMPEKSVKVLHNSTVFEVDSFEQIAEDVYSTGKIPVDFFSHNPKVFYKDKEAKHVDDISDEQAMLLSDGILITGCCHRRLINTVETCRHSCPSVVIKTIVGGLHLLHCSDEELGEISKCINSLNLEKIILLHCTGDNAKSYFCENLNCQVVLGKAGDVFDL